MCSQGPSRLETLFEQACEGDYGITCSASEAFAFFAAVWADGRCSEAERLVQLFGGVDVESTLMHESVLESLALSLYVPRSHHGANWIITLADARRAIARICGAEYPMLREIDKALVDGAVGLLAHLSEFASDVRTYKPIDPCNESHREVSARMAEAIQSGLTPASPAFAIIESASRAVKIRVAVGNVSALIDNPALVSEEVAIDEMMTTSGAREIVRSIPELVYRQATGDGPVDPAAWWGR